MFEDEVFETVEEPDDDGQSEDPWELYDPEVEESLALEDVLDDADESAEVEDDAPLWPDNADEPLLYVEDIETSLLEAQDEVPEAEDDAPLWPEFPDNADEPLLYVEDIEPLLLEAQDEVPEVEVPLVLESSLYTLEPDTDEPV